MLTKSLLQRPKTHTHTHRHMHKHLPRLLFPKVALEAVGDKGSSEGGVSPTAAAGAFRRRPLVRVGGSSGLLSFGASPSDGRAINPFSIGPSLSSSPSRDICHNYQGDIGVGRGTYDRFNVQ